MQVKLFKKVKKNPTVIEGFPGFGLVGTIATEYLIDHLDAKEIGTIWSSKIPAIVAIHQGKVVEPLGIFYDEKNNIIILRAIATVKNIEWELADAILDFCNKVKAKEIISIEGIGNPNEVGIKTTNPKAFYYTTDAKKGKKFEKLKLEQMKEGIIMGVTASILSKQKDTSFIFAESYSNLPDAKAAAKIIEILDNYLGLKVDFKPLLEKAEKFEKKIKTIIEHSGKISKQKEGKEATFGYIS